MPLLTEHHGGPPRRAGSYQLIYFVTRHDPVAIRTVLDGLKSPILSNLAYGSHRDGHLDVA
jgi:hypothetical protein